jgi:thiol:disulfide interchange protein DsbC
MNKYILVTLLLINTLLASNILDKKVISYAQKKFTQNKDIKIKNISIKNKKVLFIKDWYAYKLNIKAYVKNKGIVNGTDILFSNGELITSELININNNSDFKNVFNEKISKKYYKKSKLIAGNENATNKIIVFSDPLCPACQQTIPNIIEKVNKNSNLALYYYHFPLLSIHPAALTLSKAMIIARNNGIKNIEEKIYLTNFSAYFNARESNDQKILDGFNKIFKTKIIIKQINNHKLDEEIKYDMQIGTKLGINGTPTIYVNEEKDSSGALLYNLIEK